MSPILLEGACAKILLIVNNYFAKNDIINAGWMERVCMLYQAAFITYMYHS